MAAARAEAGAGQRPQPPRRAPSTRSASPGASRWPRATCALEVRPTGAERVGVDARRRRADRRPAARQRRAATRARAVAVDAARADGARADRRPRRRPGHRPGRARGRLRARASAARAPTATAARASGSPLARRLARAAGGDVTVAAAARTARAAGHLRRRPPRVMARRERGRRVAALRSSPPCWSPRSRAAATDAPGHAARPSGPPTRCPPRRART